MTENHVHEDPFASDRPSVEVGWFGKRPRPLGPFGVLALCDYLRHGAGCHVQWHGCSSRLPDWKMSTSFSSPQSSPLP